jgi:hypothetical protein
MKTLLVLGVLGLGWWWLSSNNSSSTSNYSYNDSSYYDDSNVIDRYDALSDYWDEISEYLDGTYYIEACSDNSDNCYELEAEIDQGEIDTIYFPNGGYLGIYSADVDSDGDASGYDDGDYGDYWRFEIDEDDIEEALEQWSYDYDFELE